MKRFHESLILPVSLALVVLAGCAPKEEPVAEEPAEAEAAVEATVEPTMAIANLAGVEGSSASGTVSFTQVDGGVVHVVANVEGLTQGLHGFHIHENGDCSAADFTSAGGHYDPTGAPHACPPESERHAGDLGNMEVGEDGLGELEISSDMITLGEGMSSVAGKAVVVHGGADDCQSQPSGAAGARMLCGVIEMVGAVADSEVGADEPVEPGS